MKKMVDQVEKRKEFQVAEMAEKTAIGALKMYVIEKKNRMAHDKVLLAFREGSGTFAREGLSLATCRRLQSEPSRTQP